MRRWRSIIALAIVFAPMEGLALIGGHPAGADFLCLDKADIFVPCPTITAPPATVAGGTRVSQPSSLTPLRPDHPADGGSHPSDGAPTQSRGLASRGSKGGSARQLPTALAAGLLAVVGGLLLVRRRREPIGRYQARRKSLFRRRRGRPRSLGAAPIAVDQSPRLLPEAPAAGLAPVEVPQQSVSADPPILPAPTEDESLVPSRTGLVQRSRTGIGLHRLSVSSLMEVAAALHRTDAVETDFLLVVPAGASKLVCQPQELIEAAELVDGVCVGASPVPLASPAMAHEVEQAIAAAGISRLSCHPYPHALLGRVSDLRELLADLPDGDDDADRLTEAMLSGRNKLILDMASVVFHVLDGTGADVVVVDGRAYANGERTLVLIDPNGGGHPRSKEVRSPSTKPGYVRWGRRAERSAPR